MCTTHTIKYATYLSVFGTFRMFNSYAQGKQSWFGRAAQSSKMVLPGYFKEFTCRWELKSVTQRLHGAGTQITMGKLFVDSMNVEHMGEGFPNMEAPPKHPSHRGFPLPTSKSTAILGTPCLLNRGKTKRPHTQFSSSHLEDSPAYKPSFQDIPTWKSQSRIFVFVFGWFELKKRIC